MRRTARFQYVRAGDGDNTVHIGNAVEGVVAGRGLGLGSLGVSRAGDNDVVIQASAHEAGAVGRAERADDAGLFAELEADAAGGQDLLAVQVNSDGALGVILVVDKGNRVPLPCRQVLGEAYSVPLLTLSTAVPSVLRGMMRKLASAEGPTSTTEVLSCSSLNLKSVYSVKLVRLKKLSPSLMAARHR